MTRFWLAAFMVNAAAVTLNVVLYAQDTGRIWNLGWIVLNSSLALYCLVQVSRRP